MAFILTLFFKILLNDLFLAVRNLFLNLCNKVNDLENIQDNTFIIFYYNDQKVVLTKL